MLSRAKATADLYMGIATRNKLMFYHLKTLLKDKIPRYHGILSYSDFYIFINILLRNSPIFTVSRN